MKTLCINLKRSRDRKNYINGIFENVTLPKPKFINAIDYKTNGIKPAEACFASHQLAWNKVSKEKAPVLIIEDDVVLHPAFAHHAIKAFNESINLNFGVLLFGYQLKKLPMFTSVSEKIRMVFSENEKVKFNGAYGYLLSPDAAKKLLLLSKDGVNEFPDLWLADIINQLEVSAGFLKIPLITHGSLFPSTLNHFNND